MANRKMSLFSKHFPSSIGKLTIHSTPISALTSKRYLVVWILLAMAIGIILGNEVPSVGPALQKDSFVGVSVPIAVGLLVMMYPILCKVRYETVRACLISSTQPYVKRLSSTCSSNPAIFGNKSPSLSSSIGSLRRCS